MSRIDQLLLMVLTLMLSGRAMTLAFIGQAGGESPGDPPAAWLMPLVGDAVIGVTALLIAYFIWKRAGLFAWTSIVVWNSVAIWDALSAYLINRVEPWPEFFMLNLFGTPMFFVASLMHGLCIYLVTRKQTRQSFFRFSVIETDQ